MTKSNLLVIPDGKKIVGQEAVSTATCVDAVADFRTRATVRMKRPSGPLMGLTYQLKWPHNQRKIYMTCNFVIDDAGRKIPLEIFFNGGDSGVIDMLKVISRQTSSILQRGGDVRYVIKDFIKDVSPYPSFICPDGYAHPFSVASLAAYIGFTLFDFLHRCDYPGLKELATEMRIYTHIGVCGKEPDDLEAPLGDIEIRTEGAFRKCPECGSTTLPLVGCSPCTKCGYSKCE